MRTSELRGRFPSLLSTILLASAAAPAMGAVPPDSPERQTMAAMRALAGALISREVDEVSAELRNDGPASGWVLTSQGSNLVRMPPSSHRRSPSEVFELLQPREDFIYLCDIPERDAWGGKLEVYYETENLLSAEGAVTVRSAGANRHIDSDVYEVGGFLPGTATDDIVIHSHRFVRWPLGVAEDELRVEPKAGRCPGSVESPEEVAPDPARGADAKQRID